MGKTSYKKRESRARRKRQLARRQITCVVVLLLLTGVTIWIRVSGKSDMAGAKAKVATEGLIYDKQPDIDVELLSVNEYSRPGTLMEKVNGIVIHYTANPGTTAIQNRGYFEGLKDSHQTKASAHFVVGLDGEIVQCIPTKEMSYASNERNIDTISIECCHEDETGRFNEQTYDSLVELTAFLLGKYNLTTDDVIRHYDVTGKICPKYYVENESSWQAFKDDVNQFIVEHAEKK